MHRRLLLKLLATTWAAALEAIPQSDYVLHANSTLVVIPVSVTDASNRFVLNLQRDRFSVFEDGVPPARLAVRR